MYEKISDERWNQAQSAERKQHTFQFDDGVAHYAHTYYNYFRLLNLGTNLDGLAVIEVGPADFPALNYCSDWKQAWVVEPMPSKHLSTICSNKGIGLIPMQLEQLQDDNFFNKDGETWEVWLLNVMQHIADPDAFIKKALKFADRIRFFEPINYPTSEYHPHTYTMEDFTNWFGDCVKYYKGGSIKGFHESDCAYGTFINY